MFQVGQPVRYDGPSMAFNATGVQLPAVVTEVNYDGSVNIDITTEDGRTIPAYGQPVRGWNPLNETSHLFGVTPL